MITDDNYNINLKAVYSCPADEVPKDIILPRDWTLSWHQVETLKALRDLNIDVIMTKNQKLALMVRDINAFHYK